MREGDVLLQQILPKVASRNQSLAMCAHRESEIALEFDVGDQIQSGFAVALGLGGARQVLLCMAGSIVVGVLLLKRIGTQGINTR